MAYVEDSNQCRIPLDSNIIRTKAVSLFNSLRDTDRSNDSLETFVASKGLFERFKDRSGLRSIQMKGEAASADCEEAKEYPSSFQKIVAFLYKYDFDKYEDLPVPSSRT